MAPTDGRRNRFSNIGYARTCRDPEAWYSTLQTNGHRSCPIGDAGHDRNAGLNESENSFINVLMLR